MSEKDKSRSSLSAGKHLRASRSERPSQKMGDLHLKRYGIIGRASQSVRRGLKRSTSKRSRQEAKSWLRRWQ